MEKKAINPFLKASVFLFTGCGTNRVKKMDELREHQRISTYILLFGTKLTKVFRNK